jgi:Mg-chelatase subunit ChlD
MDEFEVIDSKEIQTTNTTITLECINEFPSVKRGSGQNELTTMIHIKAPKLENVEDRKKNLRAIGVIDISGSMSGAKLNLAKESLTFMVGELNKDDEFGLVTFETEVDEVLPVKKMDDENKKLALHKISKIMSKGCTNLSGGLFKGIEQVRRNLTNNSINGVLLFTDGQANNGIRNPPALLSELNKKIDNKNDHVIYTFGFGEDHNSDLLKKIADTGYGTYSFIQDTSAMKEIFTNCLAGLMSTVAQNLKLVITPSENFELVKAWTKFKCETEGISTVVSIKDLFSEESRDILVVLKANKVDGSVDENLPLIKYNLTYDNVMTGSNEQINQNVSIKLSDVECTDKANLILDEQRNRMIMIDELEKANQEAERGELAKANERISTTQNMLFTSPSAGTSYTTGMMNDLTKIKTTFADERTYHTTGAKMYADKTSAHIAQRCNAVLSDSDSDDNDECKGRKVKSTGKMYSNDIQKKMQKKSRS